MARCARIALIALFAGLWPTAPAGAQGTSPFCVVNSIGSLLGCSYETLDYCQQMARSLGGACVVNPGAQSRPTPSPSTSVVDEALKWQEVDRRKQELERTKRQPLLDCLKVMGPSGLPDCERLLGPQK